MDEDVESIQQYTVGGFHPIRLGDVVSSPIHQYRIHYKLGRGSFSTVWLGQVLSEESRRYVALKICAANEDPEHELSILKIISQNRPDLPNVAQLRESFSLEGPNGTHTVLVHDVLGSILNVVHSGNGNKYAKAFCRQVTSALAALHRLGIAHGDFHPGNIGVALPTLNNHTIEEIFEYLGEPERQELEKEDIPPGIPEASLPPYLVYAMSTTEYIIENDSSFLEEDPQAQIMDFGNAIVVGTQTRPFCTAAGVCAPELLFELVTQGSAKSPPTIAGDLWSLGCTIYEIVFGGPYFRYAFPNDGLLETMAIRCGEIPPEWIEYWNSNPRLSKLSVSPATAEAEWQSRMDHLVTVKGPDGAPVFPQEDLEQLFDLLRSLLKINPQDRISAEQALGHPWFSMP